ncbi:hypothetical protein FKO01_25790 [Mesorhizobium sp. B2-3-3]|uniref:hypothetical protein n=1 Tax=Streptomyces TaxID=1883 RepID=UPI0011699FF2|nr:hypothetical protein FKO01_25790 [Mesorhizobium sp. B2-3-3]
MFELLPDVGLRLPGCAGTLRFGMDERTAQWAVATVADVRDGWVCGARWAFSARYRGLTLDAYGDTTGRSGGHQDAAGLAGIGLSRAPLTLTGPAACAVVLRGIDLFGYPTAEVSDAFSDSLPQRFGSAAVASTTPASRYTRNPYLPRVDHDGRTGSGRSSPSCMTSPSTASTTQATSIRAA